MSVLPTGLAKSLAEDYTIDQSLRCNEADNGYLTRTPSVAGDRRKWTVSVWIKRGHMGSGEYPAFMGAEVDSNTRDTLRFYGSDAYGGNIDSLHFEFLDGGVSKDVYTEAVYRDPSSWYHVVFAIDTDQAVDTDRCKIYVNGDGPLDHTSGSSYPARYRDTCINATVANYVAARFTASLTPFSGYLAELYFIDGQQLTPSSFAETDEDTNQWKPIDASDLTFGTNGFYQKYAATELANSFTDSSSARTAASHTVTVYGDVHTDTTTKKVGTASAEFDGVSDYLTIPASSQFDLTETAATFETWVYFNTLGTSNNRGILDQYTANTSVTGNYRLGIVVDDQGDGIDVHLANSWLLNSGTSSITTGTWYHVALTWTGDPSASSNLKLYLDGTLVDTATASYGPDCSNGTSWFGRWDTKYLDGYLDEFRISNTVRYTEDFTPSTSAFTPDANTLLLLHFDGTDGGTSFPDDGPHTITPVGDVANARGSNLGATYTQVDAITATGAGTWTCPTGVTSVEILTVAGGGGAGDPGVSTGGGGGAGGVVHNSSYTVVPGVVYDVTVGAGGAKGTGGSPTGTDGSDSVFNVNAEGSGATVTALGGGGGGQYSTDGNPGGSGGGQGSYENSANTGTGDQGDSGGGTGYGNDGGTGLYTGGGDKSGGGGGAGGAGGNATTSEVGDGGVGKLFSTFVAYGTDSSNVASTGANGGYFGGGGGGASNNTGGAGGPGIGGVGGGATSTYNGSASNGQANTGGGGGASGASGTPSDGGSGVVLIAYSQDKPGTSSIVFDGSGDGLSVPNSTDFQMSGDFTYEAWFYDVGGDASSTIFEKGYYNSVNNDNFAFRVNDSADDGKVELRIYQGEGSLTQFITSGSEFSKDTWNHIAMSRSGSTITFFMNGVSIGTLSYSGTLGGNTASMFMGRLGSPHASGYLDGYLDEIRVSNTARYTTTFTPQTTQFTADANTMLLIHSDFDGGLGADSSGNKNDFSVTNLVATDQMKDSPTNNFSTWNPLASNPSYTFSLSEGNLKNTNTAGSYRTTINTIGMTSGKWYFESYINRLTSWVQTGIIGIDSLTDTSGLVATYIGSKSKGYGYNSGDGKVYNDDDGGSAYGNTYTADDIIGIAVDLDNSKLYFSKNGTWQNSGVPTSGATGTGAYSIPAQDSYYFGQGPYNGDMTGNWGQDSSFAGEKTAQGNADGNGVGDFFYEPPSGYLALATRNLPTPEIKLPGDHFNTVLWSGNDTASTAITGLGLKPDFLWIKARDSAKWHQQLDVIRGVTKQIFSNESNAETTNSDKVESFDSDGFTLGTRDEVNGSGITYVGWGWKGGGAAVANTTGSLDALVSANTTAGFSIVKFDEEGTGADATIGHGLSQRPELVIGKPYDASDAWRVGSDFNDSSVNWEEILQLQGTGVAGPKDGVFDGGDYPGGPTASIIYLGDDGLNNTGYESVLYCFHSVEGYSKVGSFVGNYNADGTFIYLGFRPAWFMWKRAIGSGGDDGGWAMMDNKRSAYNVVESNLYANDSGAEETKNDIDFVSNGVKMRNTAMQGTSTTYLYLAFAKSPFKYANAR